MVDWNIFRAKVRSYMDGNGNSIGLSNVIVDSYIDVLKTGGDILSFNSIVSFDRDLMFTGLNKIFDNSFNSNVVFDLNSLDSVLNTCWLTSVMSTIKPYGNIVLVSNTIVNGGSFLSIKMSAENTIDGFIESIISYFEFHLKTIGGVLIGTLPNGTTVTLNYTGYV